MANPNFVPSFSTNEIFRDLDNTRCLTDDLDTIDTGLAGKAESNHVHSGYAVENHTHTGYANSTHTHTSSEITDLATALANKADASTVTAKADLVDGKVPVSQLPSFVDDIQEYTAVANFPSAGETGKIYVATDTNKIYRWGGSAYVEIPTLVTIGETPNCAHRGDHGKHAYDHSVNGDYHVTAEQKAVWSAKAAADHTHTAYALTEHTHSELLSADGGSINGAIDVAGVIKANGQQAFYYNTTANSQTIGTNNATGGTNIACGSSATVAMGGALVKTPTLVPKATNTYYCGNTNFRWKGIYSTAAVNVSSDKRLKRDIESISTEALADFVRKLDVVSYNYKTDEADAKPRIGLIAQDVQAADPELAKFFVHEDEDGMLGITSADLVFALIATVQELRDRIAILERNVL